jgi:hypothetical protein
MIPRRWTRRAVSTTAVHPACLRNSAPNRTSSLHGCDHRKASVLMAQNPLEELFPGRGEDRTSSLPTVRTATKFSMLIRELITNVN